MRYELGILMAEEPDNEALVLLGYRISKMRQEIDALLNERDKARMLATEYRNLYCVVVTDKDRLPWE